MKNRFEVVAKWIEMGMPELATFSVGSSTEKYPVTMLEEYPISELAEPATCFYYDPEDVWVPMTPYEVPIKLSTQTTIRCREITSSIDDAFNDWYTIEGLLLSDVNKWEYQYLAGSENYNRMLKTIRE